MSSYNMLRQIAMKMTMSGYEGASRSFFPEEFNGVVGFTWRIREHGDFTKRAVLLLVLAAVAILRPYMQSEQQCVQPGILYGCELSFYR